KQGVLCASTGNTSASAAAYATRAGMTCAVLVPRGKIALGKLAQAVAHGARILQIAGQASAAYEVCDQLGQAPDVHCLPVGNAGNITAYWQGYRGYHADGLISDLPRMFGFQAAGAAPLVHGGPVKNPETIATAIRIGAPASWDGAVAARDESNGRFAAVTD